MRITGFDWKMAQATSRDILTPEETCILDLLADGKSTYKIAKLLRMNRSAVWFAAARIRAKLDPDAAKESEQA